MRVHLLHGCAILLLLCCCWLRGPAQPEMVPTTPRRPAAPAPPAGPNDDQQFQQAQKLLVEGKEREAFRLFLIVAGGEHIAARIAWLDAQQYQTVMMTVDIVNTGTQVVRGDLLLTQGKKDEALAQYRNAAEFAARNGYYPVEPPFKPGENRDATLRALPFQLGPGSQRDNWLIRRFITLEAWGDAGIEFARIWNLHRMYTKPYAIPANPEAGARVLRVILFDPHGFNGFGLQFAIDYVYFLKQRGQPDQALTILLEPILKMDMDRNPNTLQGRPAAFIEEGIPIGGEAVALRRPRWGVTAGFSRKEYLRLAYGEFKAQGKEEELLAAVQKQIDEGDNRARRVLARLRMLGGQPEEALALELAYIDNGKFDALTTAYRRGLIYEEMQKNPEAIAEYEKVLNLPYTPPVLPDADEVEVERSMMRQWDAVHVDPNTPEGQTQFQTEVLRRLQRLYGAVGEGGKALDTALRMFDVNENLLVDFNPLGELGTRLKATERAEQFTAWAAKRAGEVKHPLARANLCWIAEDYDGTVEALAEVARGEANGVYQLEQWKDRFRKLGKDRLRTLLAALVEANPKDARARLELLDLEDHFAGPEVIAALEMLLNDIERNPFGFGKGSSNRTRFRNYHDLAYRLLRLYEKNGQLDELQALGVRIATTEKPFNLPDPEQESYRNGNGLPEDITACLSLAIQHADTLEKRAALAEAMGNAPRWADVRTWVLRRGGKWYPAVEGYAPAAWVPAGVKLIASQQNALTLCTDGELVYAGHPWGVSVYDADGTLIWRVALGVPVAALAYCGGAMWAGTPAGLFRIDIVHPRDADRRDAPGAFFVKRVNMGEPAKILALPPAELVGPKLPDNIESGQVVNIRTLAAKDEVLWIGTWRDVRAYDVKTNTARVFSPRELGLRERAGRFDRFLFDRQYVWADGDNGCRRYDTEAKTWQAPVSPDPRHPVGLIGVIDGELWGHAWVDEKLRDRPCIIDRETLRIQFIPIGADGEPPCLNGPFCYYGRIGGKLIFGDGGPRYVYDADAMKLKPLQERTDRLAVFDADDIPDGLRGGTLWRTPDGMLTCTNGYTHHHTVFDRPFHARSWSLLTLKDGMQVLAGAHSRETWYQNPYEDIPEGSGGVIFRRDGGLGGMTTHLLASTPQGDALWGDEVYASVADGDRRWLCTSHGLVVLDREGRVAASYTRRDGLPANAIMNGVKLGGKLYFAARWGDNGGGLVIFDPATGVFTSLTEADGLAANSLQAVAVEGNAIKLIYGVQYLRYGNPGNARYRQHPPGLYHPDTGEITAGGEPRLLTDQEADKARPQPWKELLPYLGGTLFGKETVNEKTYLYGSRGLVILDADMPAMRATEELKATVVADPRLALIADAQKRRVRIGSPAELAEALKDPNPFYRANALASPFYDRLDLIEACLPAIAAQLFDEELRVRCTALYMLMLSKNDAAVLPPLRRRLNDTDEYIRGVAAVELVKRGEEPDIALLRNILGKATNNAYSNFPFGADSSVGVLLAPDAIYRAIAPRATPALFTVLLENPLSPDGYGNDPLIFPKLGEALLNAPKGAEVLLTAYDTERYQHDRVRFAQAVFKHAGTALLPTLHAALASPDRVVRSNAARACGAIADPSSIPHLLKALDMESGLARASIVWALGELKAREALHLLVKLYIDAQNDEKRRSGFRMAQSDAQIGAEYERLSSLDAVGAGWNELKAAAEPKGVDIEHEQLLTPAMVLEAARKIGPEFAQEFYRALAGEKDRDGRLEAAAQLAEGAGEDLARNIPTLRHLLGDNDTGIRMAAAASLVLINVRVNLRENPSVAACQFILDWLSSPNTWERQAMLRQLARVREPGALAFARERITALATDVRSDPDERALAQALTTYL
jgi:HEAT repeat protein/predicted negative regulator of RcsB-dependent stress response